MRELGRHLVVELWECQENLNNPEAIRKALVEAVRRSGATLIDVQVHTFNPHGVSGVAVIAESHISLHTWPEHKYVALDVFTCGEKVIPEAAFEVFRELFRPKLHNLIEIKRGIRV